MSKIFSNFNKKTGSEYGSVCEFQTVPAPPKARQVDCLRRGLRIADAAPPGVRGGPPGGGEGPPRPRRPGGQQGLQPLDAARLRGQERQLGLREGHARGEVLRGSRSRDQIQ